MSVSMESSIMKIMTEAHHSGLSESLILAEIKTLKKNTDIVDVIDTVSGMLDLTAQERRYQKKSSLTALSHVMLRYEISNLTKQGLITTNFTQILI